MSVPYQEENEGPGLSPRLLSITQAYQILGLSRTSLYSLLASDRIRSVTVGRRRLVPREAIDEYIAGLPTQYRRPA